MTPLESILEPLRHSPQLIEAVELLEQQLRDESVKRQQFYADMTEEQKVEFIDGEVILHSPARRRHLDATKNLLKLLDTHVAIHELGEVQSEKCLCLFPRNDYEPDIVFFGTEKAATLGADTMKFPIPDLIVEVLSKSTTARDRGVKFEDYAAHGVAEYWIVDSERQCLEQYLLEAGEYRLAVKSGSGEIASRAIEGLRIDIAAVFDASENLRALREMTAAGTGRAGEPEP